MEYAEDGELFNYIVSKTKLKEKEASYFFVQIIQGIEYIHSNFICHRYHNLLNKEILNQKTYSLMKIRF